MYRNSMRARTHYAQTNMLYMQMYDISFVEKFYIVKHIFMRNACAHHMQVTYTK